MSKRFFAASALTALALASPVAAADNLSPSMQRQLRTSFGLVVELSDRGGQEEAVAVRQVLPDSPAFRAGLRRGDLITRIGRRDIEDFADLENALKRYQLGERLRLQMERDGERKSLTLMPRLANQDEEDRDSTTLYGRANGDGNSDETRFQRLQRRLDDLEERVSHARRSEQYGRITTGNTLGVRVREWRRQNDSPQSGSAEEGVEITNIAADSPAAEAGLRRGDIITRVDDRNVSTPRELSMGLQRGGQEMTLEVLRGRRSMTLNVRLEGGARYGARDRRYERLEERIEQLENRLREMEQNP